MANSAIDRVPSVSESLAGWLKDVSKSNMFRTMPNAAASWEDMPMELVSGKNINPGNNFSLGDFGKSW